MHTNSTPPAARPRNEGGLSRSFSPREARQPLSSFGGHAVTVSGDTRSRQLSHSLPAPGRRKTGQAVDEKDLHRTLACLVAKDATDDRQLLDHLHAQYPADPLFGATFAWELPRVADMAPDPVNDSPKDVARKFQKMDSLFFGHTKHEDYADFWGKFWIDPYTFRHLINGIERGDLRLVFKMLRGLQCLAQQGGVNGDTLVCGRGTPFLENCFVSARKTADARLWLRLVRASGLFESRQPCVSPLRFLTCKTPDTRDSAPQEPGRITPDDRSGNEPVGLPGNSP